jgi:alkylmercury lyase
MPHIDIETEAKNLVAHLVTRWGGLNKTIIRSIFRLLAKGQPVPISHIAERSECGKSAVSEALESAPVRLDEENRVIDVFGFTLDPTFHRVQLDGISLYTCCALWSHFIPRVTDMSAEVDSVDPISRRIVRLTITSEGVTKLEPITAVATLVKTRLEEIQHLGPIGSYVCNHICHFTSRESAERFIVEDKRRFVVSVQVLNETANQLCSRVLI